MNTIIEVTDRHAIDVTTSGTVQVRFRDPLTRGALIIDLGHPDQAIPFLSDLHYAVGEALGVDQ